MAVRASPLVQAQAQPLVRARVPAQVLPPAHHRVGYPQPVWLQLLAEPQALLLAQQPR